MNMLLRSFVLFLAFAASGARADGNHPDPFQPVFARATYDCPPGPGYLTFSIIDANQVRVAHQLFLGTRAICLAQAERLDQVRSYFTGLTLIAICAGQDEVWYLKRWSVDAWGFHVYQGQIYYGPLGECLAAADRTNSQP